MFKRLACWWWKRHPEILVNNPDGTASIVCARCGKRL